MSEEKESIKKYCENTIKNQCDANVTKCVNNIIIKEGYENYKFSINTISTGGGNYFGDLYEVDIKGKISDVYEERHLFIKQKKAIHPDANECIKVIEIFSKEIYFYKNLAQIFEKLQDDANIPVGQRYKTVKFYSESSENMIIMENLAKRGYKTLSRMNIASRQFMELSIIQLAKFHALSFVLQKFHPQYLKSNMENLKFPIDFNNIWMDYIKNLFRQGVKAINMKTKISNILPSLFEKIPYYMSGKLSTTMCLCHGDYRISNLLVKHKEGKISDIIPVDYQFIYYGSPLFDFLYLIISSTDRQFRKNHLDDLKSLYHDSLKEFLQYFRIDVDSVYSRKQFEQDYKDYLDYGLLCSFWMFPFFFAEEDAIPDVENTDIREFTFNLGNTFKERLEGLIQDYVAWGYL